MIAALVRIAAVVAILGAIETVKPLRADEPAAKATAAEAKPAPRRTLWATSKVIGTPEPPLPYEVERVFRKLEFKQPVDISSAPGTDRLFIVEQDGKVYSFLNRPDVAAPDLMLDAVKDLPGVKQIYSIAFHPKFEQNRYCYLCCIRDAEQPDGSRILRFRVSETDPPTIDPKSEQVVITFLSGGHNGCCLKFGPDGYLYISTGDAAGPNPPDTLRTGQDCSDLLSSILRIDVDHAEGNRNYRIPPDNPFASLAGTRPEIWAYGFRNPWRMNFDPKSGALWVGDVGWELWEMLIRVERGGNYGWSVVEGRQPTHPDWPHGPTPILPPTVEHPHSESSSITAGASYYGSRLPDLNGTFIYGDYDTGKIWSLPQSGQGAVPREIADTTLRIVGFCTDNSGELLLLHHIGGTIHRLVPNSKAKEPSTFPRRLSETGLFTSVPDLNPAAGVIPYWINAEPWSDGAVAERHVAIPGTDTIKVADAGWQFPENSVLAKTLSLEVGSPKESKRRRIETQLLHFANKEWRAYTYQWNDEQTDADLVVAAGADTAISLGDGAQPGTKRSWHFASRAECLRCHNPWSGSALAFQTAQLNRDCSSEGGPKSQLDHYFEEGLCEPALPADKRPKLANPRDQTADLTQRARAYLHTNCAHCHRMHAGSAVLAKLQYDLPLEETMLVGVRPLLGTFGMHSAAIVSAGEPTSSVLLYRMAKLGSGHMPHIGSERIDVDGLKLIADWIQSLPPKTAAAPADEAARSRLGVERNLVERLQAAGNDSAISRGSTIDQLLSNTSGALLLVRAIDDQKLAGETALTVIERGTAREDVAVRDLFERFVPEEKRAKRLGATVRPEEIEKLSGEAARGRKVFFETSGVQCKNCHRIEQTGRAVGPDLDHIAKTNSRKQLLESILEPSKKIDPKFITYLVETKEGKIYTGVLVKKDAAEVVLKDALEKTTSIPVAEVESMAAQTTSLMPDLLVRDFTAQQLADLLAYLSTLQ